jgi:hypothetical protein
MTGSEQMTIDQRAAAIRELNDDFRKDLRGGRLNVTTGVLDHTGGEVADLLEAIAAFDEFTDGNDPYGEHDFGAISYMGQPMFWKIDYYDLTLKYGSPDPADPDVTTRAMTLMMAWEY